MRDPHLNIFHAYRGPADSPETRYRQLEDNLTRALVVMLTTLRESPARLPILELLGVPSAIAESPFQCRLQVSEPDMGWPPSSDRRLVVIHDGSALTVRSGNEHALRGRIDAIIASRRFVVAIESKLGQHVEQDQLDRHRQTLSIVDRHVHALTWSQLARAVRATRLGMRPSPVARFVMEQFEEYLYMNGFGGLNETQLGYFSQPPEQRDELVKEGIRRSLEALMRDLAKAWDTGWRIRVGNIGRLDTGAWAKLEPPASGQSPHLSVGVTAAGLDIFANVETAAPYRRFRAVWERDSTALLGILQQLGSPWPPPSTDRQPWRFSVVRRIPTGRPMTYEYWPALDITAAMLSTWSDERAYWIVDAATRQAPQEAVPEIKVVRSFPAALFLGDVQLVDRLIESALQLELYFTWLGEPIR
jgi:hypothetical protein